MTRDRSPCIVQMTCEDVSWTDTVTGGDGEEGEGEGRVIGSVEVGVSSTVTMTTP